MSKKIVALLAVVLMTGVAYGAPGDVWSLSGDMQTVSNPSPNIDPGPVGGGTATWDLRGVFFGNELSLTNVASGGNTSPLVPAGGIGWVHPFNNTQMVVKHTADADPNDTTLYVTGDVGGFSPISATWTTNHDGWFDIEIIGYNASNDLIIANGATQLTAVIDGILRVNSPLGTHEGSANALIINAVVDGAVPQEFPEHFENVRLFAGDTIKVSSGSVNSANDWSGFDLTITEKAEQPICESINRPAADIDDNCWVDLLDFAAINQDWLDCGLVDPLDCQLVQ